MTESAASLSGGMLDIRELRRRAEHRLSQRAPAPIDTSPHEIRGLIHELSVHQVELDMQHEQLLSTHAELEQARNRYYDLYEEAPVAYLTVSPSGGLVAANRMAVSMLQLRPESFSRRRFLDLMAPAFHATYQERREPLLAGGAPQSFDAILRRQDGSRFWATVHMSAGKRPAAAEALIRVAIVYADERKRVEGATARLATIVTSANLGIFSHDLSGTILSWNDAAVQLLGYAPAEIVGQNTSVLLPAERKGEDVLITSRLARGERVSCDTVRLGDDGVPVAVGLTASPVFNETGTMIGVSQVLRDIREQVSAREALRLQMDQLREHQNVLEVADRRKDELIATLAHELRNPLTAIHNAAALLKYEADSAQRSGEIIERQIAQMSDLIEDLLDVTRLAHDQVPVRRDLLRVSEVLEFAVEASLGLVRSRQHQLRVELPEEPLMIKGDKTRLIQVFCNLIGNAAKYTERGGDIRLIMAGADGAAEIRVRDSGIGMDPQFLPHAFELFSQVGTSIDRTEGGLGIGLYLVRKLVELHGGSVSAASAGIGQGSEFVVRLPLAQALSPADQP